MVQVGSRLGSFEVLSLLGEGGMGQVWRARDVRLKREVALKVLPAAFAADADRVARFQREAELLATLTHPNIAAIYGLEEADGVRALVLELVEGETLAERVARGPLGVDEVVALARQLAEALDYAHEHGVLHRDLKPANLKVTPDGQLKVLDFGLAKELASLAQAPGSGLRAPGAAGFGGRDEQPTITSPAFTQAGMLIGTVAYMAPEQARGKSVDKRADIWAFGCVLYELLTGRRAFEGETISDALAAVLARDPDWTRLPAATPAAVRTLLARCLARDPKDRLRDIGEARHALAEVGKEGTDAPRRSAPLPASGQRRWLVVATASVAALVAGVAAAPWLSAGRDTDRHAAERPVQFIVDAEADGVSAAVAPQFEISPDGRRLILVGVSKGVASLWLRDMASKDLAPLPNTNDAAAPFWSPDSRTVGFFANGRLKTVNVEGGPSVDVCAAGPESRGGTWNQRNEIVFSDGQVLQRVSASGGALQPLTTLNLDAGETSHRWPSFLPDGRRIIYLASSAGREDSSVRVASLDSAEVVTLLRGTSRAVNADGHLLFVKAGTLMAQPFDPRTLVLGAGTTTVAQVSEAAQSGYAPFAAGGGSLAYAEGDATLSELVWRGRDGARLVTVSEPGDYRDVALSPDETRVAVTRVSGTPPNRDVWTIDAARGTRSRITSKPTVEAGPTWSPDGTRLAFLRAGENAIYVVPANGGDEREVFRKGIRGGVRSWSPDGRWGIATLFEATDNSDLWIVPMEGSAEAMPFARTKANESGGVFSPDGRWVAYASDESGRSEVYVQAFPVTGAKVTVSRGGGAEPEWRADGRELFFLSGDGRLMAVSVSSTASEFGAGEPSSLFEVGPGLSGIRRYTVARDGQRFLFITPERSHPLTFSTDWLALLKE